MDAIFMVAVKSNVFFAQVGVIDISSRLVLSTVGNYPGVTEVEMKSTRDLLIVTFQ